MRLILLLLISICISGCSKFFPEMRRSANMKLFDTQGFKGKKRLPAHNAKYVKRAKNNLMIQVDSEAPQTPNEYYEEDEMVDYYKSNRRMYQDMLEMYQNKKRLGSIGTNQEQIGDVVRTEQLQSEINELRQSLQKTLEALQSTKSAASQPAVASNTENPMNNIVPKPKIRKEVCACKIPGK